MARLPQVRPRGTITPQAPSSISPAEVADPFRQIGDALNRIGGTLRDIQKEDAAYEGQDAVYRDESGTLRINTRPGHSQTARAYNRAAYQAYATRLQGDIRIRGNELRNEAGADVKAFSETWKGFSDQLLVSVPREVRGAVRTMLDQQYSTFSVGISEQKRARDIKTFEGDIKAEIGALDAEMAALARQGGTGTDDYQARKEQLGSLWGELVENPEFTVGEKEAAIAIDRMQARHMSEGIVGDVERTLQTQGVGAARQKAQVLLDDPDLELTPSERRQYFGIANQRINTFKAEAKVALKPVQDHGDAIVKRLKQGVGIDDDDVDQIANQLAAGGDVAGALELISARSSARILKGFALAPDAEQVGALEAAVAPKSKGGRGDNQRSPSGSSVEQTKTLLRGFEGFRSEPYWDVDHWRVGYGSDQVTLSDGSVRRTDRSVRVSRADAERDLDRRVREFEADAAAKAGQYWQGLPPNVKAALSSVTYNYGELPDRLMPAIRSGDPANIAAAINALGGDNGGVNRKRRAKEAALAAGTASIDIDPAVISEMQAEVTRDAKEIWDAIETGMDNGFLPSVDDLDLLTRQMALIDDEDFRSQVVGKLQSDEAARALAELPADEAQALSETLSAAAELDGVSVAQQEITKAIRDAQQERVKALKTDPIDYAQRTGIVGRHPGVDPSSQGFGEALAANQRTVSVLRERGDIGNVSALRPSEEAVLQQHLVSSTPAQQAATFATMAQNLSPETYQATMAGLAGKDGTRVMAMAGSLMEYDPIVAEGVLRGAQLLKENAKLAPSNTDDNRATVDDLLLPSAFAPGLEGARQTFLEAARARYADLSNQVGDTSGDLVEDRMTQAIEEVTGGVVEMNGGMLVAPSYGMGQDQFDAALSDVSESDIAAAAFEDGTPITLREFRRQTRLRSIGAGEYLVEIGPRDRPTFLVDGDASGQPFVFRFRGLE